jgi:hypothetical protein
MKNMSLRNLVDKASQILFQSVVVIIVFTVVTLAAGGVISSFIYNSSNNYTEEALRTSLWTLTKVAEAIKNSKMKPFPVGYSENVMTAKTKHSQLEAGHMCRNFDGDSINIHGVIKNISPAASYKDAVVKITYYSDAVGKEKLGNKEYTIHEVFPPHSDVSVKLKAENFKDVNTIGWEIINATTL